MSETFRTINWILITKTKQRGFDGHLVEAGRKYAPQMSVECSVCGKSEKSLYTSHMPQHCSHTHKPYVSSTVAQKQVNILRFYICVVCTISHISIDSTYFVIEENTLNSTYQLNVVCLVTNLRDIIIFWKSRKPCTLFTCWRICVNCQPHTELSLAKTWTNPFSVSLQ